MIHHLIYLVLTAWMISHVYSAVLPTLTRNRQQPEKLSIVTDWNEYNMRETDGPGTYAFGYDVEDAETGNIQFRSEEKFANGSVIGSYGYVTPEGNVHMVHYVADHLGYRSRIEDGRKPLVKDNFSNSHEISPQMNAALQSLENYNRYQNIQEQHVRPTDKISYMNPQQQFIIQTKNNKKNYEQKKNGFYNVYYVPSNMIYN